MNLWRWLSHISSLRKAGIRQLSWVSKGMPFTHFFNDIIIILWMIRSYDHICLICGSFPLAQLFPTTARISWGDQEASFGLRNTWEVRAPHSAPMQKFALGFPLYRFNLPLLQGRHEFRVTLSPMNSPSEGLTYIVEWYQFLLFP